LFNLFYIEIIGLVMARKTRCSNFAILHFSVLQHRKMMKTIIRLLAISGAVGIFVISRSHRKVEPEIDVSAENYDARSTSAAEIVIHPSESCLTDAEQTFVSLCSCKADNRGLHQNVIAFSLYGNFSDPKHFDRYVDPIKATLANISQVYPGK